MYFRDFTNTKVEGVSGPVGMKLLNGRAVVWWMAVSGRRSGNLRCATP